MDMEARDEIAQARLQQASTHWMRHTFLTDLFDSGADVLSVRDLMDCGSISAINWYLHRAEERLRAELERLARNRSAAAPMFVPGMLPVGALKKSRQPSRLIWLREGNFLDGQRLHCYWKLALPVSH